MDKIEENINAIKNLLIIILLICSIISAFVKPITSFALITIVGYLSILNFK